MKKLLLCMGVLVLFTSSTYAAPVGPAGRLYYTVEQTASQTDDMLRVYRIDVDTNWDVVDDCGNIGSVLNDQGLNTYWYANTSPEILHPRADKLTGLGTGGDGSLFLGHFYDNGVHTRFTKMMPDGTTSLIHPGIGSSDFSTRGQKHTQEGTALVVDVGGGFAGKEFGICRLGNEYGNGVWQDINQNDGLTDDCDAFYSCGYRPGQREDAEIGGSANDSSVENTHWSQAYNTVTSCTYSGNGLDCHTWAGAIRFYYFTDWPENTNFRFRLGYRRQNLAVGDTDNDGNTDVYVAYETWYGGIAGSGIVRMADLDDSGMIDHNDVDMCRSIYNNDTLGSGDTVFANNLGLGDLELIRDPATGKCVLLSLQHGSSWDATDGRILAFELSDNGDFVGTGDGLKLVYDGIETGGPTTTQPTYQVLGMEFDADVIPEPGTMLLIGTGLLGAIGYIRRRRMR